MPEDTPKHALVVRGGWLGHVPVEATDRYIAVLERAGYSVAVSDSLDAYLDADALAATDLIVQCWTMGEITGEQLAGLSAAIRAGTGFAGWHGGIIDAFRGEPLYHLITGGQFLHHPKSFVDYGVRMVSRHAIVAGLSSFRVTTEQYWLHVDPANEVLAVTELLEDPGAPGPRGTVPVAWVRHWGEGRVFVTVIGHNVDDLEVREVDTMITRGLAWATR
jgi:type 1 glutamine amidotransferase